MQAASKNYNSKICNDGRLRSKLGKVFQTTTRIMYALTD